MKRKFISGLLAAVMTSSLILTGCGSNSETNSSQTTPTATPVASDSNAAEEPADDSAEAVLFSETEPTDTDNYVELALNVYYNDSDNGYYDNEAGSSLYIMGEGQFTLTFDCATDLSDAAKEAGVTSLTNLTAIYLLDMGVAKNNQSPMTSCSIKYDSISVDGTELTITQEEPKSALKSSGVFDTNDPINSWDGSCVDEVTVDTSNHIANFSTVENPTTVSLTFTLSDISWGESDSSDETTESTNDYVNSAVFSDLDFTSMDALTLSTYLGNGINLGNTLEATSDNLGSSASVSSYETAWGQPVTTEAMIKGMKNCGFDTIRIPVAWSNSMDWKNGDYTISEEYLDRVEEVVNYALDNEMFVILNDHWDSGWWAQFGSSEQSDVDEAWKHYEELWTQVADRFKDYSDMLIFESANEELGNSLNDNSTWSNSGALSSAELYEMTNAINQKFVDLIRNSGGNNDDRFLLIAGYNTDITMTCNSSYVMPTDTADSKLLISVHYYTPWNYCGSDFDATWGLKSELSEMENYLSMMTKFTDEGYGVIIGEYAALPYWTNGVAILKSNTYEFTKYMLDLCDIYNFCPVLWSCNDLFSKSDLDMASDELSELFTSRCYAEEAAAGDSYLTTVQDDKAAMEADAPEQWASTETYEAGTTVAWIMWNGGAGTYSVGDEFNAADCTAGITATNVVVDGAGEYSVSLDFAGGNDGLTFAALGLASGEDTYPGAIINITSITVDGKELELIADPYTSSDDGHCTRVNLLNEWVPTPPDDARTVDGDTSNISAVIIDKNELVGIKNITVNFELITE
jgi:endoglucanase